MDKLMPHNADAERAVLGSILLDRDAILPLAPWLTPDHFYTERHAWVYSAMLACVAKRTPPDLLTVADQLRRLGRLDVIGGVPCLIELSNAVPTAYHVEYYARIVEHTATRRRLIQAGGKIAALGYAESDDLDSTLGAAQAALTQALTRQSGSGLVSLATIVDEVYQELERGIEPGIATGIVDFDRLSGGLHGGDLLVLAGRPAMGKTSLALRIAYNIARNGHRVQIFELEMPRKQLFQRLGAMLTGIEVQRLRKGTLTQHELFRLTGVMGVAHALPMAVDDTGSLSLSDLRLRALKDAAEHGPPACIVVDYLQLVHGPAVKNGNRVEEVSAVSRGLKALAKELNCTVLALAQLSRAVEGREDKRPILSDLRESGQIEADADLVSFIYRDEVYDPRSDAKGIAELIVAKHRNGPLDMVPLFFNAATTNFDNLAPAHRAPPVQRPTLSA